jgi:hypothetical protein
MYTEVREMITSATIEVVHSVLKASITYLSTLVFTSVLIA